MLTKGDRLKMLKGVPLFEGLSGKELAKILEAGKEKAHAAGRTIVEQGAEGVGFHLILEGQASVVMDGRKRATLGPGSYFGEISLIDGGPRTATVTSLTPMRTFSVTSWRFLPLVTDNPTMARKVMQTLCARLRDVQKASLSD